MSWSSLPAPSPAGRSAPGDEQVTALLKQLSDQTRRLAQQEMKLVAAELAVKGKAAGIAAGLLSVAGLLGLVSLLTLTAALVLLLATAVVAWLAAVIVTVAYLLLAALLALVARGRLARAAPLAPTQAVNSVKEDIAWLKTRAKSARR